MNEEIEKLLEHCVEYATDLLTETGESYPFGAFADTIGNVHPLEMEVDKKNIPNNGQVIKNLTTYCEEEMKNERIKGYALAYEVSMEVAKDKGPIDAILFDIKHTEQTETPIFCLPFTISEDKKATVNELFAVKRQS